MASRLTTMIRSDQICLRNQEIAGSTPAVVIFFSNLVLVMKLATALYKVDLSPPVIGSNDVCNERIPVIRVALSNSLLSKIPNKYAAYPFNHGQQRLVRHFYVLETFPCEFPLGQCLTMA